MSTLSAPTRPSVALLPWLDRAGRLSWLKLAAFLLLLAPGLYLAGQFQADALGPKPITALLHATGEWAVRILLFTLAVSPMRRIGNWPRLILIRRMLGLGVLAYALIHFSLYVIDQNFALGTVAAEIARRFYLTIGFVALVGLIVLGVTSTDGIIRRLGRRWTSLHRFIYPIAALGLVHHFLQAKIDVSDPLFAMGVFLILMGYRLMQRVALSTGPLALAGLAALSGLLTAGIEAAWYGLKTGVPATLVLEANLDFSYKVSPAWWVFGLGLLIALIGLSRGGGLRSTGRGRARVLNPATTRGA